MASKTKKRAVWCLTLLLFVQASLFGGAGLTGGVDYSDTGKKTCQITLDVCGKLAPSMGVGSMDPASNHFVELCFYFPTPFVFPPSPAMAVASAETGETERPPKA